MADKHIDTDYDEDEERKADEGVQVYYVKTEDHQYRTDQTLEERFQLLQMNKFISKDETFSARFSQEESGFDNLRPKNNIEIGALDSNAAAEL